MKDQQLSIDLGVDDDEIARAASYCWWRSAGEFAKFDSEEVGNIAKTNPRFKVLREMERLAMVAPEGLGELKQKLVMYRGGDFWVPIGGLKKEEMEIPPIDTILLVGFHNSGKSSLVNLMYSVLGRSGLIPFAQTSSGSASKETTLFMEEHNVVRSMRNGFCVYDTRGFDYDGVCESFEELSEWMANGVRHNQLCLRSEDAAIKEKLQQFPSVGSSSKFAKRRVNCVMVVANAAEIYKALKAGDRKPLMALRELFCCPALRKSNENPILILTHGDKLSTEERIDARLRISDHLGVSEATGVYDIVCLTEHGFLADESDPVTAYALCEAIYRALIISDRGHLPKRNLKDWTLLLLSRLMCLIATVFAVLAHLFNGLGQAHRLKL